MDVTTAVTELNELAKSDDGETAHGRAEEILLAVLRAHQLGDVADAWDRAKQGAGFMYA